MLILIYVVYDDGYETYLCPFCRSSVFTLDGAAGLPAMFRLPMSSVFNTATQKTYSWTITEFRITVQHQLWHLYLLPRLFCKSTKYIKNHVQVQGPIQLFMCLAVIIWSINLAASINSGFYVQKKTLFYYLSDASWRPNAQRNIWSIP